MGQGYNFLSKQDNIDVKNYTGMISNAGTLCKENYTDAKWIHTNFDEFELDQKYDYSYERPQIHHMEIR